MKLRDSILSAALLAAFAVSPAFAAGPSIDWDPAYGYQPGATISNHPVGSEFKMVGVISGFDIPFQDLNALDPTREYTFVVKGLISQGTVASGPPSFTFYETQFTGGTIEIYEDLTPQPAAFDPNPPNATVPSYFEDGTLILAGSFTRFVIQANNFTAFQTGNIEGDINWTGGTLLSRTFATGERPCPGLFTGGMTWRTTVGIPGYLYRHDGKIDLQCPTDVRSSTWGKIKSMYR
jgi:hypothetical protein